MLEIRKVNKSFGKKVILKKVSFQCEIGDIIGIFGRNGSGKSSLLNIIYGTLKAESVNMNLDSRVLNPKDVILFKHIGYVPQDTFLHMHMKVRNLIPLFFIGGEEQDKIFYSKGVAGFENKIIGKLSSGQLRYLEVLLVGNLSHPYLMLDEPFSMLEPIYKEYIKTFLKGLKQQIGILITDHYYRDVLEITNRNFMLKDGKKWIVNQESDLIKYNYLKE